MAARLLLLVTVAASALGIACTNADPSGSSVRSGGRPDAARVPAAASATVTSLTTPAVRLIPGPAPAPVGGHCSQTDGSGASAGGPPVAGAIAPIFRRLNTLHQCAALTGADLPPGFVPRPQTGLAEGIGAAWLSPQAALPFIASTTDAYGLDQHADGSHEIAWIRTVFTATGANGSTASGQTLTVLLLACENAEAAAQELATVEQSLPALPARRWWQPVAQAAVPGDEGQEYSLMSADTTASQGAMIVWRTDRDVAVLVAEGADGPLDRRALEAATRRQQAIIDDVRRQEPADAAQL